MASKQKILGAELTCSPDLYARENNWQRISRVVEQLESYIGQEWNKSSPLKVQQMLSVLPRSLQ